MCAALVVGAAFLCIAGCRRNVQSNDAVRQAVLTYLGKRTDLLAMDVSVTSVAFHNDEATATVHFQAKGNTTAAAGMNMQYILERSGSQWVVKGRAGSGNPHGGAMPQPSPGSIGAMPQLPPGHPAVNPENKAAH